MSDYKEKIISLNKDRRLIASVKKAGLETFHPKGDWNGYGYKQLPLSVRIKSISDMRKFNRIKKELEQSPSKQLKTQEDQIFAWARRLSGLTECTVEEAIDIAESKLDYKQTEIMKLEGRQEEQYSTKRESLIKRKKREQPLRRIRDATHANKILAAHRRHTQSDYDYMLDKAHELESLGELERGSAQEYALSHMTFDSDKEE